MSSSMAYVNAHRLRCFEQRLLSGALEELNIAGLARACGFKSKTSLYRVFRQKHGMTPGEWVKGQQVKSY